MNNNYIITRLDKVRISKVLKKADQAYPELLKRIETADIIDALAVPKDLITMNCHVLCQDVNTTNTIELTLVYPHYENEQIGHVSILSDIGIALFSSRLGQTVQYRSSQNADVLLKIIDILYQPEKAGHYLI